MGERQSEALPTLNWAISTPPALSNASSPRLRSFIAGRLCAELALHRLTKVAESMHDHTLAAVIQEGVGMGPQGEPIWPLVHGQLVAGSITHSERWALAVVSLKKQISSIGIDCEELMDAQSHAAALQVCFTERELKRFADLERNTVLATILYSVKEAFYKAVWPYVRRFVDFKEVEILVLDIDTGILHLESQSSDLVPLLRKRWLHLFTQQNETVHAMSTLFNDKHVN